MQSIINLFQDSDNSNVKFEKDKVFDNSDDSDKFILSHSLNQGNKFKNYQNKIQNNLEKSDSLLIKEYFDNMSTSNDLTKESYNILEKTKITQQNKNMVDDLINQYNDTLIEFQTLTAKLSGSTTDYINRVNPNNMYLNKNIKFTTGELAHVTNQGIVKLLPQKMTTEEQNFFDNESGCPKITNFISLDIPWKTEYNTAGTKIPTKPSLVMGTPMTFKESCCYEGKNVYVD
jgi:hypothetical protein